MAPYLTFLSLGLAWLASLAHTYGIDSSCDDVNLIQQSADAAITMAQGALNELNKASLDPNVDRLLDLLFRPSDRASGPADDTIIARMKRVYGGVALFQGKTDLVRPSNSDGTENQVNVFCNLDRVEKRSNDDQWVDSTTDIILKGFTDKDVKECTTLDGTLAFTWTPERFRAPGSLTDVYTYSPSQVTLCPWFYHFARFKALKRWRDLKPKAALAAVAIPLTTGAWPFTPIDAINLLDKVLLHEFTHTVACGMLEDVRMAKDGAPVFGVGYGWKAATALAKQEDNDVDPMRDAEGTGKSPLLNSDSFALFASGVRLLSQTPKEYIKDGGWVTEKAQLPPSKRDVPNELRYKQTPAAFEGFITSIRAERAAAAATAVEAS